MDSRGDPKGGGPKGFEKERIQKGKIQKGEMKKGWKSLDPVGEEIEIARSNYPSQTERETSRGQANCRDEYEYEQYWSRRNARIYLDGLIREARRPTKGETRNIDGRRRR